MIATLIVGIVTKNRVVSIAALAVIGGCWVVGSLGLTVATLDTDDKWKEISSKFWGNVMALFAVGSGLIFAKWVATHY